MVICEDDATGIRDMVTNPVLVVEVLSPSSERWDRVGKFTQYRRIKGLREYVLVSQDEMLVEWYTRRDNDDWIYRQASGPDDICHLNNSPSIFRSPASTAKSPSPNYSAATSGTTSATPNFRFISE